MNGMQATDMVVLAILAVSGLWAFMRGFVHEMLSLGGWVGATFAGLYGHSYLRPLATKWISQTLLADIVSGMVLFVAALVVFSMITHGISRRVQDSHLGVLDRMLGFGFGLLRGGLIVCLAWLVMNWLVNIEDQDPWIRDAKTRPLLQQGADILVALAPSSIGEAEKNAKAAAKKAEEAAQSKQMLDQLMKPAPEGGAGNGGTSYDAKDRSDLDRLIKAKQ